jgi:O-antigen/teichoic acid export membrane protein
LLVEGNRFLLKVGASIALLMVTASPWISRLFNMPITLFLAAVSAIPIGMALPIVMGALQGQQRFVAFASLSGSQAALKLVAAVSLGVALGPVGVVLGISLATAVTYLVGLRLLRHKLRIRVAGRWWRPALGYLPIVVPSTFALAVLLSADVLAVKHFFPTNQAGEYSAVAAVSRAIYWASAGVAAVLFPKVVFREMQGRTGVWLVAASSGLVIIGGLLSMLLLSLGSRTVLNLFAGEAYAGGAAYLPWYAAGMTLLGVATVLIATHQSRGRGPFLGILLPLAALEPIAIAWRHASLLQVVQVVDICMALLVTGLALLLLPQRSREPLARRTPAEASLLEVTP